MTPENNYTKFKLYTSIRGHKKSIVAVETQGLKSNVVSISKENAMIGFDISHEQNFKVDETVVNANLTALHYDQVADRLLLGTGIGEFYIYSFKVLGSDPGRQVRA